MQLPHSTFSLHFCCQIGSKEQMRSAENEYSQVLNFLSINRLCVMSTSRVLTADLYNNLNIQSSLEIGCSNDVEFFQGLCYLGIL